MAKINHLVFESLNKSNIQIYCDMDGVLTNFEYQAKKMIDINHPKLAKEDPDQFWDLVNKDSEKFWLTMPWMKDGKQLWNYVKIYDPYILTALPKTEKDVAAKFKREWLSKNIGDNTSFNALTVMKHEKKNFADKNTLLIDDDEKNIEQFKKHGGKVILHKNAKNTIQELRKLGL